MKKGNKFLSIIILLSLISIGFAYLTSDLSLNGSGIFRKNSWSVYFANVEEMVEYGSVNTNATIDSNKTTIDFNVHLDSPGSIYYLYTDIINDGTIDAMIDTFSISGLSEEFLDINLTYSDGVEIKRYDLLKAGSKDTIQIEVKFTEDITIEDLPNIDGNTRAYVTINYIQSDENAKERSRLPFTIKFNSNGGVEAQPNIITKNYDETLGGKYYTTFVSKSAPDGSYNKEGKTLSTIVDSTSPTGLAYRILLTQDSSSGGYYWGFTKLITGEPYFVNIIAKGFGKFLIGHEQGGTQVVTLNDSYENYTKTFIANSNTYHAIIFYTRSYKMGDYIDIAYAELIHLLPETSREGYTFAGWYTEKYGGTRITNTTTVNKNTTYYAHWEVS